MRSAEDIITLVSKYPLVTVTPTMTRVLKTPEEIRQEADRDRIADREYSFSFIDGKNIKTLNPNFGKAIEKLYSSDFRKKLLDMADKGETVTLTTSRKVTINHENVRTVESIIRRDWTIREIISAAQDTRGGPFISTTEPSARSFFRKVANKDKVDIRWTYSKYGVVTETHEEDRELTRLWEGLVRSAYLCIGAGSVLEMQAARLVGGHAFADEGDGMTLYDMTLNEIAKRIPDGVKARIERDLKPERSKREQQAAAIGGDVAKKDRQLAEGAEIVVKLNAENAKLKKENADLKARLARYE